LNWRVDIGLICRDALDEIFEVTFCPKEVMAGLLKMDMMAMMIAVMRYTKGLFEVFASRF
jgi:hypothetical protein